MKIMITGVAGFIGSQLAYHFYKKGTDLILIDNFSYGRVDNFVFPDHNFEKEVINMDIRDEKGIAELMKNGDVDFIYNMAGVSPLPDNQINPQEAISVNVIGVVNLMEQGRKYGLKKFIQASTNAMYENETKFPTIEDDFKLPTLIYPNTKYTAERFIQSYCDAYGMSATCMRFANVYGPHIDCLRKQPPFVGYMIRELYYNRTPVFHSDGNQKRDYVYVSDLIELADLCIEGEGFDTINVSSNKNYSVNELYSIASYLMNKNIKPEYASDLHYWEKYSALYEGKFPIKTEIITHEINKFTLCDNARAKNKYGWQPKVDIEVGLKKVIDYTTDLLSNIDKNVENK